ncbi:hypothetical protein PZ938_17165 [Luteipulveratus sp. YIM 133132]|uniref:hypothetical protein n=1 Tax=Luteipulveratus flavus TaxID=3031728 RepID=UPI0023AFE089|nr:hypothetical protein [Luteipulveratus sp. YIM 133132]MDE9367352.1 hypothetical protein [Luteipulveratus sp. YIM 133132]
MGRPGWRFGTVVLTGVLALVAGVVMAVRERTTSFGWFAYSPSDGDDLPRFVTDQQLAAVAVAVTGLLLLAGCVGYLLALRVAGPPPSRPPT